MATKEEKRARLLLNQELREHKAANRKERMYSAEDIYGDEKASFVEKIKSASSYKGKTANQNTKDRLPFSTTSDLIDIVNISNGTIHTSDDRYLKIVEVYPINFLLKSLEDQTRIIRNFQKFLAIAPAKMQIKSIATKADVSKIISAINRHIKEETNSSCIAMQKDYRNLVATIGASEGVSRRFFLIVEYERKSDRANTEREIEQTLTSVCNNVVSYLKGCGNKVVAPGGESATNTTLRFIYDILNREYATEDEYVEHLNDIYWYYKNTYGENPVISPSEYVAPRTMFFGKDYTLINNTYYDFMTLRSNGIPTKVYGGWLSLFVNAGAGIDVDIFISREDKSKMLSRTERKVHIGSSLAYSQNSDTTESDSLASEVAAGRYIRSSLASSGEEFYYTNIMITISSSSLEGLIYKRTALKNFIKAHDMSCINCNYLQEEAFESYLPLCKIDKTLYNRSLRNVLTTGLSSYYPFTSFELCDPDGIYLGTNEMNDSLAILDIFNSKIYKNANMAIMGVTGAGKTYLLQLLTMRFRRNGIQTFIIAPDKGHEFKRGCDALGGEFITIAPSSQQCINIMEIRKKDNNARMQLNMFTEESELANKIETLHIFFNLLVPDISAEEDQLLDEAIINTYAKYGITFDNKSLEDGHGNYKQMPILGDLHEELVKENGSIRIANILNRMVNGSARSFNNQTNVDLSNKYVILNISPLGNSPLLPAVMFIVLDMVYSIAKEDITKKKVIAIDECGEIIGAKSNAKAAAYVNEIFAVIRGYGGSAICATQNYSDFMALEDGKYGKGIINNSKTKIILNMEPREAKAIKELLELSQDEYDRIISFDRGFGLLSSNGNNVPIHFKASRNENLLITTDRGENERIMRQFEDDEDN